MKASPRAIADAIYAVMKDVPAKELDERSAAIANWLKRRGLLPIASRAIAELADAERRDQGREQVNITSATKLDADLLAELVTAAGADPKKTEINHTIDANLVSGAIVKRSSSVLDLSLAGHLNRLTNLQ